MIEHCMRKNLSQKVYKYLLGDIIVSHNKYLKWANELGQPLCEDMVEFGSLHMDIYKVTNVPKFRSFQYRLLQRGLVTNVQLHKWGVLQNYNCSWCKLEKETVSHLFYFCDIVQDLWKQLLEWISKNFSVGVITFNVTTVLCNRLVQGKGHVVNFMCLITKQYIYSQRCLGNQIHFGVLVKNILALENIEKYIAIKKSETSETHSKMEKISPLYELMNVLSRDQIRS